MQASGLARARVRRVGLAGDSQRYRVQGAVAKSKRTDGRGGYVFFKELGGAPRRTALSKTARLLVERGLARGRVLDYGCGHGFDADTLGWDAFDPYYRANPPEGSYDTIVVNRVVEVLTRRQRHALLEAVGALLADGGTAYLSVARNVPVGGKAGPRRRLVNYVVFTLPSIHRDAEEEIYMWTKGIAFEDRTQEFEERR